MFTSIHYLKDDFNDLTFYQKLLFILTLYTLFPFLKQICFCIMDLTLRMELFVTGSIFLALLFTLRYKIYQDTTEKNRAGYFAISYVICMCLMFHSATNNYTYETLNLTIGKAFVNVFGQDLFLVSNNRGTSVDSGITDTFIVRDRKSEEAIVEYYTSKYPELMAVDVQGTLMFIDKSSDIPVPLIMVSDRTQSYFNATTETIYSVHCLDPKYKKKTFFGLFGYYDYKDQEYLKINERNKEVITNLEDFDEEIQSFKDNYNWK